MYMYIQSAVTGQGRRARRLGRSVFVAKGDRWGMHTHIHTNGNNKYTYTYTHIYIHMDNTYTYTYKSPHRPREKAQKAGAQCLRI